MRTNAVVTTLILAVLLGVGCGGYDDGELDGVSSTQESLVIISKCGDGWCTGGETAATCPQDCGSKCGNGKCELWLKETVVSCPQDCGGTWCGNGTCELNENSTSCSQDCYCGNGSKDSDETCDNSSLNPNHRCPTSCGTCEQLVDAGTCQARCVTVTPCCNNGICEVSLGEDADSCSAECYCGNGIVDSDEKCDGDCPTECDEGYVLTGLGCYRSCAFEGDGLPLPGGGDGGKDPPVPPEGN